MISNYFQIFQRKRVYTCTGKYINEMERVEEEEKGERK